MRLLSILLLSACGNPDPAGSGPDAVPPPAATPTVLEGSGSSGPTASPDTAASSDTAASADTAASSGSGSTPACGAEIVSLTSVACVETTGGGAGDTGYVASFSVEGSGGVTEVGGVLAPVAGSAAATGFDGCGGIAHQVRLVDGAGETWTLGWDVTGTVDDDSGAAFTVGASVDFLAIRWLEWGGGTLDALVVSDGAGPLVVLDEGLLTTAQRGGIVVDHPVDSCARQEGGQDWLYHPMSFTEGASSISLWPGAVGALPLPAREIEIVVVDDRFLDPCPEDWCGGYAWAAWAR